MSRTVDFLHNAKVFYLATVEGVEARIRPINSVIEHGGRIYFETSNKKEMYQQILKNPNIAISGMADGKWIRIMGKAVIDETDLMKKTMFSEIPELEKVYSYEELVTYYIEDMKSTVYSFDSSPVKLDD